MDSDLIPFKELLANVVDNRGKTCPTAGAGIPLIATNCISNDRLYPSYEKIRYVSQATYETWFRGHPQPGDFIFVTKGSPGHVCMTPDPVDFCIAQDMLAIRADKAKIYPNYLFALLRSPAVQAMIENMHVGTLIPHFKKGDFDKLFLPVPDRLTQQFIGDVYLLLSKKVELDRRMNETLEAIAIAIFKSWFVDFIPVRAKAEGRQPEGMDAETAALFPDGFEDSELGEIPRGWEVTTLGSIAEIVMGQSPKGDTYNDLGIGIPLINGPVEFGEYHPKAIKWTTAPTKICEKNDLIVCVRGSTTGRYVKSNSKYCLGRGVCAIRSADNQPFVDQLYQHEVERLLALATGSTFPSWSGPTLKGYKITAPTKQLMDRYSKYMAPLWKHADNNSQQLITLSDARDTLLPKLLSGEIRVKDAEHYIKEAI